MWCVCMLCVCMICVCMLCMLSVCVASRSMCLCQSSLYRRSWSVYSCTGISAHLKWIQCSLLELHMMEVCCRVCLLQTSQSHTKILHVCFDVVGPGLDATPPALMSKTHPPPPPHTHTKKTR